MISENPVVRRGFFFAKTVKIVHQNTLKIGKSVVYYGNGTNEQRENMKTAVMIAALLMMLSLTACRTDFRTDAAERARKYALKYAKDISETDRNYIRYNDPEIYTAEIFKSKIPVFEPLGIGPNRYDTYEAEADRNLDFMHTAFVWNLPKAGFTVVVDGSGERSQRGWSPEKLIFKKYIPEDTAFSAARIKAIQFIANFFPDIKTRDLNHIRFSVPEILATSFRIEPPDEKKEKEIQIKKWMEYIRSGDLPKADPVQISLVWYSPISKEAYVVCGTAPGKNLNGWVPKRAYLISLAELDKMTLKDKKLSTADPRDKAGKRIETPDLRMYPTNVSRKGTDYGKKKFGKQD